MDIYEILFYAVPVIIIIGIIFYYGRKVLRWSENNHTEITEQKAMLIRKAEKDQVFRNHSSGGMGIPVTTTRYYLTFRTSQGKNQRFNVPMNDYIKFYEGDEGTLKLQGARYISFEKEEESTNG